jgi:hypothetical protein
MPFSGQKFPYWVTITYGGTANPSMGTENILMPTDGTTQIAFSVTAAADIAWASGFSIFLTFYNSANTVLGPGNGIASSGALTAGQQTTVVTAPTACPAGTAYAIGTIQYNGTPSVINPLKVYEAKVVNVNNPSSPQILNQNYAFLFGYLPWQMTNNSVLQWNFDPLDSSDSNFDSLVINNDIEVLGGPGGVPSGKSELIDPASGIAAKYRLYVSGSMPSLPGANQYYDLGAPQPTQDLVESLLLDGERPFGQRSSNRTISLTILIWARTLRTLGAAREHLLRTIDQDTFQITWTPASSGLPLVFDCFRALPTVITYGFNYDREGADNNGWALSVAQVQVQALPYGRSGQDGQQQLSFANNLVDGLPINQSLLADDFDSVVVNTPSGYTSGGWRQNTAMKVGTGSLLGPASAEYQPPTPMHTPWPSAVYRAGQGRPAGSPSLIDTAGGSATSQVLNPLAAIPAGTGIVVVLNVADNTSQTITVKDSQGTVYTQQAHPVNANAPVSQMWVFTGVPSRPLSVTDAITVSSTVTQTMDVAAYAIPGMQSVDSVTSGSNAATTTPSIAAAAGTAPHAVNFVIFTNSNNQAAGAASGWTSLGDTAQGAERIDAFWQTAPNQNPSTCTSSYGTSSPYAAVALRVQVASNDLNWNIVGLPVLAVWFGQSYDTQWPKDPKFVSNVTLDWTLWDNNGQHLGFSVKHDKCPWGADPNKPVWTRIEANIPQNRATFNYSHVTAYDLRIRNWSGAGAVGYVRMKAWLNGLTANPGTIAWANTPRGSVYTISGVTDMARSPVSTEIQLPAQANTTVELTKSGTWLVPAGVSTVAVETWGGGGGGASVNTKMAGGGGGGGEYAADGGVSVTPGTQVPVTIGTGGTGAQLTSSVEVFTAPGSHKWVCPTGVTSIHAEAWGGGAAGCAGGGGGGGGEYAAADLTVVPGNTYSFTVGAGGKPNWSKLAKDQASRNGGFSKVIAEGTGQWIQANGGESPVTGGSNGGKGGVGSTAPTHHNGGPGGSSPGSAGGGGGSSATTLHGGGKGGNSPQAGPNGKYKTGGKGFVGQGDGNFQNINDEMSGSGGNGANAPGTPTAGKQPGGGGGGGYTLSVNNNGASGGNGLVRISYKVNGGGAVNGGSTVFGQSGLTNTVVTAHGGATAGTNTATGGAGGTGSGNATAFAGGSGGLLSSTLNEYLFGYGQAVFSNLSSFTGTAATFTSAVSGASVSFGTGLLLLAASSGISQDAAVTDSAGNVYDLIGSRAISGGTGVLYAFQCALNFPVTTSTTISLSNNPTSVTYDAMWLGSNYFEAVLADTVAGSSGSGTTSSVTYTNPTPGGVVFELFVDANNGSATYSGLNPPAWVPAATGSQVSGTLSMSLSGQLCTGSSQSNTETSTLSASTGWARLAIPFVPLNQETALIWLNRSQQTTASTSTVVSSGVPADAGSGTALVVVTAPAASTVSVTDTAGNAYTSRTSTAASGGVTKVFTSVITSSITPSTTWTVTDGTNQTRIVNVFFLPDVTFYDATASTTTTGATTTPTVTSGSTAVPSEIAIGIAANNSGNAYSNVSGWAVGAGGTAGTLVHGVYIKKQQGSSAVSFSATPSAGAAAWNATLAFVRVSEVVISGAGGSSGGPQGIGYPAIGGSGGSAWTGGGKGADGATGANTTGNAAALPGGGGSGANSDGTTSQQGGAGGRGMVRLTWTPPLRTFNDFVIHRPAADTQAKFLNPITDIPPNDPPDNREYIVPSLVPGRNAQFGGTYTVLLVNHAWNNPGTVRRISVTINQYEYVNGPVISAQCTRSVTPATDIVNGYVSMGEITLPIKDYDPEAAEIFYTVSIHDTNGGDRFQDLLFLDTMGQTVLVSIAEGTAGDGRYSTFYVDEPSVDVDLGQILGTGSGRDRAISVLDMALATGGPLYIDGQANTFLVYSTSGAPNLGVTYSPRWYSDRLE